MSGYSELILGLLTAVVFYGFFGVVIPEYLASDAYHSIVPAMKTVVLIIAIGTVVVSCLQFAGRKRR